MIAMKSVFAGAALSLACLGASQSVNIDLGNAGSASGAFYPGAASAGFWNSIAITGDFERVNLTGLEGSPVGARYYQYGLSQVLNHDIPGTFGDDQALMDDMALSFCSPVDGCVWVENLLNGEYEVVIYALTPGNSALLSPTRVDFGTPGPTLIGGAWPGQHVQGTTFSRHRVTITTGRIGLHSGTYNGFFQSGMNGIQLTYLDGPTIAAYPESAAVSRGLQVAGDLASLRASDNDAISILCDELDSEARIETIGRSPVLDPEGIVATIEFRSTHSAVGMYLDAYNYLNSSYTNVGFEIASMFDTTRNYALTLPFGQWLDATNGSLRLRARFIPFQDMEAADGWSNSVDLLKWQVDP